MKSLSAFVISLSVLVPTIAAADQRAATGQPSPPTQVLRIASIKPVSDGVVAKPAKVSCEDLMKFDQASRPQRVYFSQGVVRCDLSSR